ncbi:amino acid ABC transporter permease [Pseudoroseomonas cervicalis]|uniref:Glutamate/aspartate import permease protein GltK n=1 Tax=Pseudoroseomonas cervicalis ATCC 49957 TaxID=525371 RepID=D5RPW7_9PROT|nr:amino acid ABC transporter permease [Pseudoroseomonas cervicalis]EFH10650.1 ABC transporter, permease protein [Pseudoroseomonas cervicalis ATCC 49957]WBV41558.1 amino acid ABC transporter permease [Pseudoroseomonas cervicalis]
MRIWSWEGFFGYLTNPYLLEGALLSIGLTAGALVCGLALGIALALLRLSGNRWLAGGAATYCWLFRGTPLLVQLLVIYTALPLFGLRLSVPAAALLGLSLNEAAYLSETVRAGIQAVPKGQREAALALGLRGVQAFRLVIWPQALRIIIPPLGNSVNGLLKTTSVASVISMDELLRRTQILIQERFLVLELFAVAALYYLLMTTAWDLAQRGLERRFGRGHATEAADRR